MNDELGRLWNVAVVVFFRYYITEVAVKYYKWREQAASSPRVELRLLAHESVSPTTPKRRFLAPEPPGCCVA